VLLISISCTKLFAFLVHPSLPSSTKNQILFASLALVTRAIVLDSFNSTVTGSKVFHNPSYDDVTNCVFKITLLCSSHWFYTKCGCVGASIIDTFVKKKWANININIPVLLGTLNSLIDNMSCNALQIGITKKYKDNSFINTM